MLKRYLLHEKLPLRFAALWGTVMIAFVITWALSYFFLPEGFLRGKNMAQVLAGETLAGGSVWLEGVRIFCINFGVMLLCIIAPNLLREEKGYPLGYTTVAVISLLYAITLGTDSFTLSQGGKLAPTLAVFGRSGIYEITAYILAAAATCNIARYQLKGQWPRQTLEAVPTASNRKPTASLITGLLLAVLILLLSNAWEAYRILLYFSS